MIRDAAQNKFEAVLVHKLDRFARNRNDSIAYKVELKRHNVSVMSVTEPLDGSPESIILESVLEAMAEYYSKNLAREVEKGKKENALRCMHVGGVPPLGYDVDKATKKLIVNENEANTVKLIFSMCLDGCGYTEIIDELRLRGYKTKRGDDFRKNSLFSILKNEKYTGVYVYNLSSSKNIDGKRNSHKYKDESEVIRVENGVPPIIPKEDFKRVQEKMVTRKRTAPKNVAHEVYLLSGKVECGVCGSTYVGNSRYTAWHHKHYVDYRCNHRGGKVKCKNKGIRRETLEAYVLDQLAAFVFDEKQIPEIVANYNDYVMTRDSNIITQREQVKVHLKEIQRDIDSIVDLLVKASSDALLKRLEALEAKKKESERQYANLVRDTEAVRVDSKQIKKAFRQARDLLKRGELATSRRLVERYINKIVIYPDHVYVEFDVGLDVGKHTNKEIPQNVPSQSDNSTAFLYSSTRKNLCALNGGDGIV